MSEKTNRLPLNKCRCAGSNCARKSECLRFVAFNQAESGVPWAERFCEFGREVEGFILNREEVEQ